MTKNTDLIRVLLVDDHAVTRAGIKAYIKDFPQIKIVEEATNGEEAISKCAALSPAVVLMDIEMPLIDGITATKTIRSNQPEVKIIMLSSHNSERMILQSFSAGASGYCLKDIDMDRLVTAIHSVSRGDVWIDASIANYILGLLPAESTPPRSNSDNSQRFNLTEREIQILALIVEGKTNQAIASALHLSVDTIKNHLKTIMDKLSVTDRTQAAVKAVREELI